MSDERKVTDNDLGIIMSSSLEAAKWLSTAATQRGSAQLRERYLNAMHNAMIAAEQARQIASRPTIPPPHDPDAEGDQP